MKKLLFICCMLLSSCSVFHKDIITASYYSISRDFQVLNSNCNKCRTVMIKVITPDFLNKGGIGYYKGDKMILSKNNLWTNKLNTMLQDVAADSINVAKSGEVMAFSPVSKPLGVEIQNELKITIYSFNGTADGQAEISGKYFFTKDDQTVTQGLFNVKTQLQGDGFNNLVQALNENWIKICNSMIKDLF